MPFVPFMLMKFIRSSSNSIGKESFINILKCPMDMEKLFGPSQNSLELHFVKSCLSVGYVDHTCPQADCRKSVLIIYMFPLI